MKEDNVTVSQYIGRSIAFLSRSHRLFMARALAETDLRGPEPSIISLLEFFDGSSQDDLASMLAIDKSGIARSVGILEDKGYVRREQDTENRRKNKIFLTDKGREMLPVINEKLSQWEDMLLKGYNEEERKAILSYLSLMVKNCDI